MTERSTESREQWDEIVDVGAFRRPVWYAEGLMALIALEAAKQGKVEHDAAMKEANEWLAKYYAAQKGGGEVTDTASERTGER